MSPPLVLSVARSKKKSACDASFNKIRARQTTGPNSLLFTRLLYLYYIDMIYGRLIPPSMLASFGRNERTQWKCGASNAPSTGSRYIYIFIILAMYVADTQPSGLGDVASRKMAVPAGWTMKTEQRMDQRPCHPLSAHSSIVITNTLRRMRARLYDSDFYYIYEEAVVNVGRCTGYEGLAEKSIRFVEWRGGSGNINWQ